MQGNREAHSRQRKSANAKLPVEPMTVYRVFHSYIIFEFLRNGFITNQDKKHSMKKKKGSEELKHFRPATVIFLHRIPVKVLLNV